MGAIDRLTTTPVMATYIIRNRGLQEIQTFNDTVLTEIKKNETKLTDQ